LSEDEKLQGVFKQIGVNAELLQLHESKPGDFKLIQLGQYDNASNEDEFDGNIEDMVK
jgi:hypothetical protein